MATLLRRLEVARHLRPAQIEVAIFQAQFLVHLARHFRVVHRERQHVGHVEHFELLHHHFDFAGGDFGIVRAVRALADLAGDADDAFAAQRRGALEKFLGQIGRIKNSLRAAFAVADVNEDEAAEVAPGMDPAGQGDDLPDVRRAQFVAMMRAFHSNADCRIRPFRCATPRQRIAEFRIQSESGFWRRKRRISKRFYNSLILIIVLI